jgi:hypothetical protein
MSRVVKMSVAKNRYLSDVRRNLNTVIHAVESACDFQLHLRLLHIYQKLGHLYSPVDRR